MFIGHFGVAFAAKRVRNRVPLWLLFLAVQLVDVAWGLFVWLGIEKVAVSPGILPTNHLDFQYYPYTHSLIATLGWSAVVYLLFRYWFFRNHPDPNCSARVMGLLVFSHYPLDVLVHRADMPIGFGDSPKIGLEIWGSVPLTFIIEIGFFLIGFLLYMSGTKAKTKAGNWGWWLFAVLLVGMWVGTIFGPPPTDITMMVISGLIMFIALFWIVSWLEKKRELKLQH